MIVRLNTPSISIEPLLKILINIPISTYTRNLHYSHAYPVTQSQSIHGMTTALTDDPRGFDRQNRQAKRGLPRNNHTGGTAIAGG